jgi:hypothetical protein
MLFLIASTNQPPVLSAGASKLRIGPIPSARGILIDIIRDHIPRQAFASQRALGMND